MGRRSDYEVVAVSYHSRRQLEGLLEALPVDLPVALVDNAGGADQIKELTSGRTRTRYVDSGGGKGFAKAANLGARTSTYDYVVFVNPDSRPTTRVFEELLADLNADPSVASASATMTDDEGCTEIGVGGWEPSVGRALVHATGAHKLLPTAGLWARPPVGEPIRVDWTTGACLAARRELFLSLGGFDERYFLYNEDVAFGRRVREAGLRQVLRTDLPVRHHSGQSGGGSTYMLQHRGAALMQYLGHHASPLSRHAVRGVLTAGYGGRVLLSRLRGRGSQAREHWAYIRGMWRGRPAEVAKAPPGSFTSG